MLKWNVMPKLNIEFTSSDMIYALNNLKNNQIEELVKNKISNLYKINENNIYLTNTGRTALYFILKALDLKKGAKIGVQLFCCPVVFESIIRAGYRPVFLEINPNTFTIDINHLKQVENRVNALIVIHTFGNPAEMDKIQQIMENKPIIEDCAQSIYSKYKNKLVGTIGDASFFSFGPGKNISAGGGGLLIINNPNLFKIEFNEIIKKISNPSFSNNFRFIIYNYIASIFYKKPWYGMFAYDVAEKFDNRIDFQNKINFDIKNINYPNIAILYKRYLSIQDTIANQRKNIEILRKILKQLNVKTIEPTPNSNPLYYLYPMIFSNANKRNDMYNKFQNLGIDTLKFYSNTPKIASERYGYKRDCRLTEKLISKLLVISTYFQINKIIKSGVIK